MTEKRILPWLSQIDPTEVPPVRRLDDENAALRAEIAELKRKLGEIAGDLKAE